MSQPDPATRRRQLAENLARVEARIAAAAEVARRPRSEVTLVVVTKTWPAGDVRHLAALGVTDVGENRDQEAAAKHAACADLALRWHFVGQIQTNKARSVAAYADLVHSIDRRRLVSALSRAATGTGRTLPCLVQVALDDTAGTMGDRGGVAPEGVPELADAVAEAPGLRLDGVMAVAPAAADPAAAFDRLAALAALVRRAHPAANVLSAGMSGDLEAAVAAGATHLRIGSAVFGSRPPLG